VQQLCGRALAQKKLSVRGGVKTQLQIAQIVVGVSLPRS
jgi:hypothetical protein